MWDNLVRLRFGVPPVAAAFVGRGEELEMLEQALNADGEALITQRRGKRALGHRLPGERDLDRRVLDVLELNFW